MKLLKWLKERFIGHSNDFQTFTYFIPAPPSRKSGYREKNFDNLIKELNTIGFEITDIKTQSIDGCDQPGLWVIVGLRAVTREAKKLKPSNFPVEFKSEDNISVNFTGSKGQATNTEKSLDLPPSDEHEDDVKGIYYID